MIRLVRKLGRDQRDAAGIGFAEPVLLPAIAAASRRASRDLARVVDGNRDHHAFQRAIVILVPTPSFEFDREFVRQPLGAAEPEAEARAGGEAVLQGLLDVGDAGTAILEGQRKPRRPPSSITSMRTSPPPP